MLLNVSLDYWVGFLWLEISQYQSNSILCQRNYIRIIIIYVVSDPNLASSSFFFVAYVVQMARNTHEGDRIITPKYRDVVFASIAS